VPVSHGAIHAHGETATRGEPNCALDMRGAREFFGANPRVGALVGWQDQTPAQPLGCPACQRHE